MLAAFRAEVAGTLLAALPDVPLWGTIPEDVNELPCVVVGLPGTRQAAERVVHNLSASVYVIGRRTSAGGAEDELVDLADRVFLALGGTRGTKSPGGQVIGVSRVDPRQLTVAGQEVPAYLVEADASATTC